MKIKVKDGDIVIGRADVRDKVRKLKDGYYSLTIKEWSRTLAQNSYYWVCLEIIGNELGYEKNELHEVFLDMFAPVMTFRDINGKPKQRKMRSSEMSTKEMSEYMNQIDQFAAEQSIILPQPE